MRFIPFLAALIFFRLPLAAETVTIAAASDLVFCLEQLHARFTQTHPSVALKVSLGSSGNFYAQIRNGAPFDVFLSADLDYPFELIKAGAAVESSLTPYAIGRIVLWTKRAELDLSDGLAALAHSSVKRIAIANPANAPYGRAAREALQSAQLWDSLQPKLVLGENISQTAQFVDTGNADAGILALSLALSPKLKVAGRYVEIPESTHAPLEQGAVLTTRGSANAAARAYLAFLRSAEARAVFDEFGFRLPN
jgi:molybdate transport system substrate-binding protein